MDNGTQANREESTELPLVSIITSTFNAAILLPKCLASVQAQDYPSIEHIFVDGASTDGTVEILKQTGHANIRWMSEPDSGIYDAWNKGLTLAKGEWIAFLGSDDILLPGSISAMVALAKQRPEVEYLSAQVRHLGEGHERIIGEPWSWPRYQKFMCAAHVGSMHKRTLYETYGTYDTTYRITADYEFLLRPQGNLRAAFLPRVIADMQEGGASDSSAALVEAARAKRETGKRGAAMVAVEEKLAGMSFRARRLLRQAQRSRLTGRS